MLFRLPSTVPVHTNHGSTDAVRATPPLLVGTLVPQPQSVRSAVGIAVCAPEKALGRAHKNDAVAVAEVTGRSGAFCFTSYYSRRYTSDSTAVSRSLTVAEGMLPQPPDSIVVPAVPELVDLLRQAGIGKQP